MWVSVQTTGDESPIVSQNVSQNNYEKILNYDTSQIVISFQLNSLQLLASELHELNEKSTLSH